MQNTTYYKYRMTKTDENTKNTYKLSKEKKGKRKENITYTTCLKFIGMLHYLYSLSEVMNFYPYTCDIIPSDFLADVERIS